MIALRGFPCIWFFVSLLLPLEFTLTFAILIICLGVGLFGFILFGTFCVYYTSIILPSSGLGGFQTQFHQMHFFTTFCLSSSEFPIIRRLICLMLSQSPLKLFLFFKICFSPFCSDQVVLVIISSRSLCVLLCHLACCSLLRVCVCCLFTVFFSSSWFFVIFSSSLLNSQGVHLFFSLITYHSYS